MKTELLWGDSIVACNFKKEDLHVEEKKGNPVPTGAMYIGLCQLRMQYVALRWQKAVAFMALNGVIGSVRIKPLTSGVPTLCSLSRE